MEQFVAELLKNEIILQMLDVSCDGYSIKDHEGKWLYTNDYICRLTNLDNRMLIGRTDSELAKIYPDHINFFEKGMETDQITWNSKKVSRFEEYLLDDGGTKHSLEVIKIPFFHEDGRKKGILIIGNDITADKKKEEVLTSTVQELEDFKFALDQSSMIAITDVNGIITYANDKFCETSQFSRNELVGSTHRLINSGYHSKRFFKEMWKTIESGQVWKGNIKNKRRDGSLYWVKATIVPFIDQNGKPYQYMAIRQDISEQKEQEERILQLLYHDELTGLRNRRCFHNEVSEWISENEEDMKEMALIFLDLNRFSYVNDTIGHTEGDKLLLAVSNRLTHQLSDKADIYRFGGDEFIIVVKEKTKEEVEEFAKKISLMFEKPFYRKNERIYLSVNLGISLYPNDGKTVDSLVKRADHAVYVAKEQEANPIQFFTSNMYENMKKTMKMEKELREAVENKDFFLLYQPQVDLHTSKIIGVEALIRWEHPELGIISPGLFIPLAEETGLILPITKWVLETACKQCKGWQEKGFPPLRIGVNISPLLINDELVVAVEKILQQTKLEPQYLDLEITESVMQNPEESTRILQELKALGVRISIDDFGTGYSSLSYIRHLPIDCLKIDQSFINEIRNDNGVIVKTIIDMASHLQVDVIAEGIESKDQHRFLASLKCDEGQGYYFGRPSSITEIELLINKDKV